MSERQITIDGDWAATLTVARAIVNLSGGVYSLTDAKKAVESGSPIQITMGGKLTRQDIRENLVNLLQHGMTLLEGRKYGFYLELLNMARDAAVDGEFGLGNDLLQVLDNHF